MAGGGSGGGQNTVQTQQIPAWEEDYVKQNQAIAAQLASRPYPTYQGDLVAGFTPGQTAGMNQVTNAATSYQPYIDQATGMVNQAAQDYKPALGAAQGMTMQGSQSWSQQSPGQVQSYMNPYIMASLGPQLQQLDIQQGQNANQIAKQATQAGAFGDARHGVADSLNNFYSGLQRQDVIGQGLNTGYNNAQNAFQQGQQNLLTGGGQMGQLANEQQGLELAPAQALAALGLQNQQQGLAGGQAQFDMGTQGQQLNQQQLNTSYQNFMNQFNYPSEGLNQRVATVSNSPHSNTLTTSPAPTNATAQNIGAFGALAGGLGSLMNGNSGNAGNTSTWLKG